MAAGIIGRRAIKHRANRRRNPAANRPQPTSPIKIVSAGVSTTVLSITFDQPVSLKGVPQYTTDLLGPTPISAVLASPTVVAITFSASVAAAVDVRVPYEDPAVRNASGGFVATSNFVI